MVKIQEHVIDFPPLAEKVELSRVLARIDAPDSELLVIFIVGMHGNEPDALFAAKSVVKKIQATGLRLQGSLLVLAGNIPALEAHQRFIDEDMNRIWKPGLAEVFQHIGPDATVEQQQARDLYDIIQAESSRYTKKYFVDLHSSSSDTLPFINTPDENECYELAKQFPVHCVLGFSETTPGTIDDFLKNMEFAGFTFEAGRNDMLTSVENHEALMWLFLCRAGMLEANSFNEDDRYRKTLAKYTPEGRKLFRIRYRHEWRENQDFHMEPGFINFQPVHKGQIVAMEKNVPVRAPMDGYIFLPMYQEQGSEGFFIVQEETA